MDPALETALQVAGVLLAATGTYFAWRQYRLAREAASKPSGDVFETKDEFNAAYAVFGVLFTGVAGYLLFNPRDGDEATLWADRGLSLGILLMAAWFFDQNERVHRVEIDDEALTFRPRGGPPVRVPWDRVTAVTADDGELVIRVHGHTGVIAGLRPMWDTAIRPGYRVCRLRDVKPSPAALRSALETHSGGRFRG